MNDHATPLLRLHDTEALLASGSLEDNLHSHAELARRLVGANSCSVMLLNSDSLEDLRLCASAGEVPPAASEALVASGEGICGRVLASGHALLVEDISRSEFAGLARRKRRRAGPDVGAGADRRQDSGRGQCDGRGIFGGRTRPVRSDCPVHRQIGAGDPAAGAAGVAAYRNPDDLARILARSFFKEMTRAGFAPGQIVSAASELIGQLNGSLQDWTQGA